MKKIVQLYIVLLPLLLGIGSCEIPSDRIELNGNALKTNRRTFTDHLPDYGTFANHICNVEVSFLSIEGSRLMTDTLLQTVVTSLNEQTYNPALLMRHPAAKLNLDSAAWTFKMSFHNRMLTQGRTSSRCDLKIRQDSCFLNNVIFTVNQQVLHYENGKYLAGERRFVNFNRETNRPFDLANVIENREEIERIAADAVNHKIREDASMRGSSSRLTRLHLARNIGITQDGLHFFYTPEECATYNLSINEFIIPYSEVRSFMRLDLIGIQVQP